jgi:conjugal transfer pilus assembly protein TraW
VVKPCKLAVLALLAGSMQVLPACARDLGVIGPVHPIAEPDMLEEITRLLKAKEANGELERMRIQGQRQVLARIQAPTPVEGLRRVQVARAWHFDPSVQFAQSVLDDQGRVIVPAGTVANPLDVVTLRSTWFLFDGRDPKQVAMAQREAAAASTGGAPLTLILVGGAPLELARAWNRPVYFDQGGRTVKRLGLTAVPARVRQDGRLLLIEELPPT